MNIQATYRLEPKVPYNQFKCDLVLKEVIDLAMEEYQYNPKLANVFCTNLAEEVKKKVKELGFDRWVRLQRESIGIVRVNYCLSGTNSSAR